MPDKHSIEIDLGDIRDSVQTFLKSKTEAILESSFDFDALRKEVKGALKGGIFDNAKITGIIVDQCEWSLGLSIREAIESQGFKDHVAGLVTECLNDPDFNKALKNQIEVSLLKRV